MKRVTYHHYRNLKVKSMYRNPWYGVIVHVGSSGVASVAVLFDRCGNPQPKPFMRCIHMNWLLVLGDKQISSRFRDREDAVPEFMKDLQKLDSMIARAIHRWR